ncbi:MAG: HpaII family restriction endonuclease [Eggerthellaceae bacterium]
MLTGNKGEWSEVYVFLKLLGDGKLYAADEELMPRDDLFFPVNKIYRKEAGGKSFVFTIDHDSKMVSIDLNGRHQSDISQEEFADQADWLFEELNATHKASAFPIERTEYFLISFGSEKIKASSADKTDIKLEIHDPQTGYETICGFSIKSEIGSPSTLLNPSGATNFVYKVNGVSDRDIELVNSIDSGNKIIERMDYVFSNSRSVVFQATQSPTFSDNLMYIDSRMDEILGHALLVHFRDNVKKVSNVANILEEDNPLDFNISGLYRYKIKKFLCAVALGFQPGREWDGRDEANGGYIIVTPQGNAVAFHAYNRDFFEDYLLDSTNFDRGSITRHNYAALYKSGQSVFMNLNMQIRF